MHTTGTRYRIRFGWVELLVLVVLIGILVVLLLPVLNTRREQGRRAVCANNLRQIGIALMAYAHDHDMYLPTAQCNGGPRGTTCRSYERTDVTWDAALTNRYLDYWVLRCPSDDVGRTETGYPRTYAISAGGDGNESTYWLHGARLTCKYLTNSSEIVLAGERAEPITVVGGPIASVCNFNLLASAHYVGPDDKRRRSMNLLYLDGHVAWVDEPTTNIFPNTPPERPPCP